MKYYIHIKMLDVLNLTYKIHLMKIIQLKKLIKVNFNMKEKTSYYNLQFFQNIYKF